jgi:phosphoserine phosphatase RsbU/P
VSNVFPFPDLADCASGASPDDPADRLREISVLQQRARSLEHEIEQRRELEKALREALEERQRAEDELRACVKREQAARAVAEANDSFKEMFLGILGHDLRNPLNTVLTTARLMAMREELGEGSQKRLRRVIASGERMQRMIEQLLDLTRARLAEGIAVERLHVSDLALQVATIVEEVRAANPGRAIELVATPCVGFVDEVRFEQVVSNLLVNAVVHGEAGTPIRVEVAPLGGFTRVSVHNEGTPILPALLPHLFDPFIRARDAEHESLRGPGLGLGLYISERIVTAHGGRIEVESTEVGTTFTALFPLVPLA